MVPASCHRAGQSRGSRNGGSGLSEGEVMLLVEYSLPEAANWMRKEVSRMEDGR